MKIIKWVGHPVVLICSYLLFITEGENFGGFYMLYLLLALPHGALYAVLAVLGIVSITIGFNLKKQINHWHKPFLYLVGLILMVSSLANFFATGNQSNTFNWGVPFSTFIIVCVSSLCFLIYCVSLFQKTLSKPVHTIS